MERCAHSYDHLVRSACIRWLLHTVLTCGHAAVLSQDCARLRVQLCMCAPYACNRRGWRSTWRCTGRRSRSRPRLTWRARLSAYARSRWRPPGWRRARAGGARWRVGAGPCRRCTGCMVHWRSHHGAPRPAACHMRTRSPHGWKAQRCSACSAVWHAASTAAVAEHITGCDVTMVQCGAALWRAQASGRSWSGCTASGCPSCARARRR